MQLATLERQVGLRLTEKQGRRLLLTPAGRLLAQHGQDIVDRPLATELEISALREGAAGTYRVAAFPSAACTILAQVWRTLQEAPELGLILRLTELEPQDAVTALVTGEVDLAVMHSYSNMAGPSGHGLTAALLFSEDVYLAIPADLAADDRPAHLADYSDSDWVLPHVRWSCHEMIQRACGAAGFSPSVVAEVSDFAAILALVGAGAGVALVPELTIAQLPKNVTLRPLDVPVQRHVFAMIRQASAADPGTLRLTELLKQAAQGRSEMPGR